MSLKKAGRPNLLGGSLIKKVKDTAIGTRQVGGVINRRQIVSIAKGDVRANNPDILKEFRAKLVWRAAELNSSVLSDLNWSKRKGTTGKIEPLWGKVYFSAAVSTAISSEMFQTFLF